jgi:hypothetical protein
VASPFSSAFLKTIKDKERRKVGEEGGRRKRKKWRGRRGREE